MSDKDVNEIEFIMDGNEECTEIVIILKSKVPMTNNDVVLELEYYINEISRADDSMNQPGAMKH